MENQQYAAQITVNSNWKLNVLGLTPIERSLIALSKAGVSDAFVLTDEAEALRVHLDKNVKDIRLHFFQKNEHEAAHKQIAVLQPHAVFIMNEPLAVDVSVLQDLTKAQLDGGGNKGTLGSEVLLLQLADFQSNGRRAPIDTMVIGNRSCHPVRSEAECEETKARLIRNLTKPTDGWASRYLNRPISTRISRVLVYTGITPNQFTMITGLMAFIPVYFVLKGGYWNWLIGAAIYHFASVLDGVDGEIARMKMLSSKLGQWLDTIFDFASMFAVLIALVISVQNPEHDQPFFIKKAGYVALWAGIGAIVSILIYTFRHKRGGTFYIPYTYLNSDSSWAKILQKVSNIGKRDFYIFLFLVLAALGYYPFALVYVAVMAVLVFLLSLQTHFNSPLKS